MNNLAWHDLEWCLRRTPRQLLELMKKHGDQLFIAGGFIRACIANEPINDIDCFVPSQEFGWMIALALVEGDEKRIYRTDNAFTIRGYRSPIQIIYRWTFKTPKECIESFDFTIAKAAFWFWKSAVLEPTDKEPNPGLWSSEVSTTFYEDLAGRRLIYTSPVRNEEAGGSLLRVLKFYQRGYRIPLDSLAAVIARLMSGVQWAKVEDGQEPWEKRLAFVVSGLLREVDPSIDPTHAAHLPSQPGDDGEVQS